MNQRVFRVDHLKYRPSYYLRVWLAVVKKSISKSTVYRFDFFSKFIRMFMIVLIQLILIRTVYANTEILEGWTIDQYYLLVGIFNLVNYIGWGVFNVNLWRIEEKVLKGEYDFLLLLPSGSIFSSSFIEFFPDDTIASLSGVILIGYYFVLNWSEITFLGVVGFMLTLVFAFVIWYCIHLVIASFSFIAVKNGLLSFNRGVLRSSQFPIDIFPQGARYLFFTILPVAFIAVVPGRILSGIYGWEFVGFSAIVAAISVVVARIVWNFNLKRYSGVA